MKHNSAVKLLGITYLKIKQSIIIEYLTKFLLVNILQKQQELYT